MYWARIFDKFYICFSIVQIWYARAFIPFRVDNSFFYFFIVATVVVVVVVHPDIWAFRTESGQFLLLVL